MNIKETIYKVICIVSVIGMAGYTLQNGYQDWKAIETCREQNNVHYCKAFIMPTDKDGNKMQEPLALLEAPSYSNNPAVAVSEESKMHAMMDN